MMPRFEVTVRGRRRSIQIEAVVDTGFEGLLCLPMEVAQWIGCEIAGWGELKLVDGNEKRFPTVWCDVDLLGASARVRAFVTELEDPLIGTELLENCQLTMDFDSGSVQLKRKEP
jgi:clan AA aspartic protease